MLNDVVRSVLRLRASELAQEQIEVRLELAADLPPVLGDRGQLQQVLLNLLVNSEQAMRQSSCGGSIRIRTRRTAGDRLALDVIDDGPGIPPEALPRIFDPFFTTKPAGVGTGLGLSIAYGIAHDHGGSIAVDSRPGCGAAFTVELPVSAAPPLAARSVETVQSPDVPARSERILVIEDEPAVAQLIADVLSEEGHRPDVALDSRKGMSLIARKRYGLVLCDLRMPHVSGRSLFEGLQKRRHPLCRRFVFVTGDALSPGVLQFLENTGVPFLAKPFLVDELKEVVRRALEQRDALIPWSAPRSKSLMSRSNPERQRVAR
jgi:CheY-like chemotaxis protein